MDYVDEFEAVLQKEIDRQAEFGMWPSIRDFAIALEDWMRARDCLNSDGFR